ncbi:helix-turn-helix domain-containing protein [Calothrix sp. FACHB-1219]|uniref:helix-turn-helix domain-containing protein n=1 Tax=unclassified Calothrix TaxID=2619626 RepID=UPI0016848B7E|nr:MULTISPECIES: helix-turn-helix domain-containing protein [unclassified Calothrix]MBD2206348.1 helix-turn-helix domain-containing protein [Calothrix sp. FACHB-168]MBD2221130.1 helix-turn-helix domain-containing protein [Calothrix sp. FACHB-1219]
MTMAPVYLVTIPGNAPLEISQEELRSLLGEIEAKLHRSKVYRHALVTLQQMLGSSAEQAKILFKAVSREAIGLAFQQFATHHQQVTNINPQIDANSDYPGNQIAESSNSSASLTSIKSHAQEPVNHTSENNLPLPADTSIDSNKKPESKLTKTTWKRWLNHNQKASKVETNKLSVNEEYELKLRQIGQQFQQARELKGWSLSELKEHTHVPLHHMDALEKGNIDLLPADVFVRGFIKVIGNVLELNGTDLAASLPQPETVKSQTALPTWCQAQKATGGFGMELRPMHLYLGYTAFVAGAVGGLSLVYQPINSEKTLNVDADNKPASTLPQSTQNKKSTAKPGIKSTNTSVIVGPNISPPEAL